MTRLRRTAAGFVLSVALVAPMLAHAFDVPPNDGFVTQTFDVLTSEQEQNLEQLLSEYQKSTSNEIAILLVESLSGASISDAGVEVGRKWRVGTAENNNGILLLAALADREVTIQTGYGLEGAVPDIVAKGIIDTDIVPEFAQANYYEGLVAAVDSLKKHIGGEYTMERYAERDASGVWQVLFVIVLVAINFFGAIMARSKSWWLGGVIGGVMGLLLASLYGWWLAIPVFIVLGLLFDYLVSKFPPSSGGGRWGGGGFGGFRGGSGGSFGGFGGGSFGGGGARGKW